MLAASGAGAVFSEDPSDKKGTENVNHIIVNYTIKNVLTQT